MVNTLNSGSAEHWENPQNIVRDSNGNLIAVTPQGSSSDTLEVFISSDDGSTWTLGSSTLSHFYTDGSPQSWGVAIDGQDRIGVSTTSASSVNEYLFYRFTIGTGGSMSFDVNGELLWSDDGGVTVVASDVTVDSTGTWWAVHDDVTKSMGTAYGKPSLSQRGSGGWSNIGKFTTTKVVARKYAVAMDTNDDIHVVYEDGNSTDIRWGFYDTSASSFTEERVVADTFNGSLITNSNNEPLFTHDDRLYLRDAGNWTYTRFSDMGANDSSSLTWGGSDIYIIFSNSGNLYENHASSESNFSSTAYTSIESSSSTLRTPNVRSQRYNANDPSTDVVDIYAWDNTNSNAVYDSVTISTGAKSASLAEKLGPSPTKPIAIGAGKKETIDSSNGVLPAMRISELATSLVGSNTDNIRGFDKQIPSLIGTIDDRTIKRAFHRTLSTLTGILAPSTSARRYQRQPSSIAGISSTPKTIGAFKESLTPLFGANSSATTAQILHREFAPIIGTFEATAHEGSFRQRLSPLVSTADNLSEAGTFSRRFSPTTGVNSATDQAGLYRKFLSATTGIMDSLPTVSTLKRTFSELIDIDGSKAVSKIAGTVGGLETTHPHLGVTSTKQETSGILDELPGIGAITTAALDELISTANAVDAGKGLLYAKLSELAGVGEAIGTRRHIPEILAEIGGVIEEREKSVGYVRPYSSIVGMQSPRPAIAFALTSLTTVLGSLTETERAAFLHKFADEVIGTASTSNLVSDLHRTAASIAGTAPTHTLGITNRESEQVSAIDDFTRIADLTRTLTAVTNTINAAASTTAEQLALATKIGIAETETEVIHAIRTFDKSVGALSARANEPTISKGALIGTTTALPRSIDTAISSTAGIIGDTKTSTAYERVRDELVNIDDTRTSLIDTAKSPLIGTTDSFTRETTLIRTLTEVTDTLNSVLVSLGEALRLQAKVGMAEAETGVIDAIRQFEKLMGQQTARTAFIGKSTTESVGALASLAQIADTIRGLVGTIGTSDAYSSSQRLSLRPTIAVKEAKSTLSSFTRRFKSVSGLMDEKVVKAGYTRGYSSIVGERVKRASPTTKRALGTIGGIAESSTSSSFRKNIQTIVGAIDGQIRNTRSESAEVIGSIGDFQRTFDGLRDFTGTISPSTNRHLHAGIASSTLIGSQGAFGRVSNFIRTLEESSDIVAKAIPTTAEQLAIVVKTGTIDNLSRTGTFFREFSEVDGAAPELAISPHKRIESGLSPIADISTALSFSRLFSDTIGAVEQGVRQSSLVRDAITGVDTSFALPAVLVREMGELIDTANEISVSPLKEKLRSLSQKFGTAGTFDRQGNFIRTFDGTAGAVANAQRLLSRPFEAVIGTATTASKTLTNEIAGLIGVSSVEGTKASYLSLLASFVGTADTRGSAVQKTESEVSGISSPFRRVYNGVRTIDTITGNLVDGRLRPLKEKFVRASSLVGMSESRPTIMHIARSELTSLIPTLTRSTSMERVGVVGSNITETNRIGFVEALGDMVGGVASRTSAIYSRGIGTIGTSAAKSHNIRFGVQSTIGGIVEGTIQLPLDRISTVGRNSITLVNSQRRTAVADTGMIGAVLTTSGQVAALIQSTGKRFTDVMSSKNE